MGWNQLENRQPNDLYATRPHDVKLLFKYDPSIIEGKIWECACGHGHIVRTLQELGATDIYASDLIDYGFGYNVNDFLEGDDHQDEFDTILTNPPYKFTTEFIRRALDRVKPGGRVIMLMPTTILAGVNRYNKIFKDEPPRYVYTFVRNTYALLVAEGDKIGAPKLSHSWFIWEKGYKGETIVRWLYEEEDTESRVSELNREYRAKRRGESPKPPVLKSENPGVRKRGSTWEARIKVNGRYVHLGRYATQEEAIRARKTAELKYRGENNNEQTDTGTGC